MGRPCVEGPRQQVEYVDERMTAFEQATEREDGKREDGEMT